MTRRALPGAATALLCMLCFALAQASAVMQDMALLVIVYALLALGMYLPLALGGRLSLAYNAYFAIGAYAVALLANAAPGWLWAALPLALLAAILAASVLALATRHLSRFHLAVATMMFGIAVQHWLVYAEDITGGATGLGNIPRLTLFGLVLGRGALLGIGIALVWVFAGLIGRLRVSLVGIVLRAQRDVPVAVASCGAPLVTLRTLALAAGAAIACLGGWLFALMNQFVLPESFGIGTVFLVLFMPVLGGLHSPWGAVLGALLVVAFTNGFDFLQGPGSLVFGLLTLMVLLAAPAGLLGWLAAALRRVAWRPGA